MSSSSLRHVRRRLARIPAAATARATVQGWWADPLSRGATSLMLNTVANAALGVGFWIAAARLFEPDQLGRDSALVSTMMLVCLVCMLNMGASLQRFLPRVRAQRRLLALAYAASIGAALVLGTAFVLLAPSVVSELRPLRDTTSLGVAFIVGTALWCVFTLQDAALTALRRAPLVPLENSVFGLLKLALLPGFATIGISHGVFAAWVLPAAVLVVPVNLWIFGVLLRRPATGRGDRLPAGAQWQSHMRSIGTDYAATVVNLIATMGLPVLVVALLGDEANATFYVAMTIVVSFDLLFINVGASATVEGAHAERAPSEIARLVLRRYVPLLMAGVAAIVLLAPFLLLLFGERYSEEGTSVLRILALASIPRAAVNLAWAFARIDGTLGRVLLQQVILTATLVSAAALLSGDMSIEGVALAWLLAHTVAAVPAIAWLKQSIQTGVAAR